MQVHTTVEDRIAYVRLDRPPANAMEPVFLDEITTCFEALANDTRVGAIVLCGTGKVFSAGVDLKHIPGLDVAAQDQLVLAINRACAAVYCQTKPVIGALNGHAIAGGMVIGLAEELSAYPWITDAPLLSPGYKTAVAFALMVAMLIWRPSGLFKGRVF